jgi:hypothetical protein
MHREGADDKIRMSGRECSDHARWHERKADARVGRWAAFAWARSIMV